MKGHETVLTGAVCFGLGEIRLLQPPGTFALTPASLIALEAIGRHQPLLHGIGMDWGAGVGCLSIAAARIATVSRIYGLEISDCNVGVAAENARRNGVAEKVTFLQSDSYTPSSSADQVLLEGIKGRVHFLLANPPSSEGDDGFEYRRIVLRGASEYLARDAVVFLNISNQYGLPRIEGLATDAPGFHYGGVLASTEWVPFDLRRPDLLQCLELYAQEEARGGLEYTFANPLNSCEGLNARAALELYCQTARSPLSKWQVHLFRYGRC